MHEVASQFNDEVFLMTLAYLIDILKKLNDLNLQLQGRGKHPGKQNQCIHLKT